MRHGHFLGAWWGALALLAGCGAERARPASPPPTAREHRAAAPPRRLALERYMGQPLRTVRATVAGAPRTFLFDTGGGVTVVSPRLASEVGCRPFGRLTAHRMSGERIDMPRCGEVALDFAGTVVRDEAAVFDVNALLPPDWAPLDGVVSLKTLERVPFTLDLGASALVLETAASLAERARTMRPLVVRAARPAGGAALDLFVAVEAPAGRLWFLVDSGNIDRTVVAPHAARALGHEVAEDAGRRELDAVSLRVAGLGALAAPAAVLPIIYDGNLGARALESHVLTFDLASGRAWAVPRAAQ